MDGGSDEELARVASGLGAGGPGARDAFRELVERYGASLVAVLEPRAGDPHAARDLAQEVWIKVLRGLERWRPGHSFRSWLFSIALNHARDASRRAGRRGAEERLERRHGATAAPERSDPAAELAARDEAARVRAALARVSEPYRTALALVDVAGLGYADAARSLACSVGTLKSRVHRGRLAFREIWERDDTPRPPRPARPRSLGRPT